MKEQHKRVSKIGYNRYKRTQEVWNLPAKYVIAWNFEIGIYKVPKYESPKITYFITETQLSYKEIGKWKMLHQEEKSKIQIYHSRNGVPYIM